MSWTDDRVALLKKLWGEGKTAAEIAKQLGGVTRNAVIGKAHRLKLSNRLSPIQQNRKPKVQVSSNTNVRKTVSKTPSANDSKKQAPAKELLEDKIKGGISLEDLKAGQCRWPQGDPRDGEFGFCGGKAIPGLPYCAEHAKVAYQAATRNKILAAEKQLSKTSGVTDEEALEFLKNQTKKAAGSKK